MMLRSQKWSEVCGLWSGVPARLYGRGELVRLTKELGQMCQPTVQRHCALRRGAMRSSLKGLCRVCQAPAMSSRTRG